MIEYRDKPPTCRLEWHGEWEGREKEGNYLILNMVRGAAAAAAAAACFANKLRLICGQVICYNRALVATVSQLALRRNVTNCNFCNS